MAKIGTYTTITSHNLLDGCDTWSVILRKEHELKVFESRMLRSISGYKAQIVRGTYRKLRCMELYNLQTSPSITTSTKSRKKEINGLCDK
jgi:hypothetical protein